MKDGMLRGLLAVATVALVALKLAGDISWSWLVVFAPVWVPAVVSVGLRAATAAVAGALVYLLVYGGGLGELPSILEGLPVIGMLPWEIWFS